MSPTLLWVHKNCVHMVAILNLRVNLKAAVEASQICILIYFEIKLKLKFLHLLSTDGSKVAILNLIFPKLWWTHVTVVRN